MQQQLALGQGYPYIRTPYADSMRPNGDMDPFHYPLYPYAGEKNGVHPLYKVRYFLVLAVMTFQSVLGGELDGRIGKRR